MAKLLNFERRYFSRISTYIFAIACIAEFKNLALNLSIIMSTVPFTFVFLLTDIPFFENFNQIMLKNKICNKTDQIVLFVERLTLHLPIIITGYILVFNFPQYIFVEYECWSFIYSILIFMVPFMILDPRWKNGSLCGRMMLLTYLSTLGIAYFIFTIALKSILFYF